jgi:hypothetical protein
MIVSLARSDLRDEFCMADEAFALSPISARAAQPREEDYDAISEAFMETSRGRWFLGEYAKRNRNADTRMVLDAVARIEQSLAEQKQPEPEPVLDNGLAEAIEAIKAALRQARTAAISAIDGLALEDHLAPVRKATRIIHEISWRWREIGADSRICDLIDSQVSAIEASCGQLATIDPHAGLSAAFDLIGRQIAAFDESNDAVAETDASPEAVAEAAPPENNTGSSAQALAPDPAVATAELAAEADAATTELGTIVSDPAPQAIEAAMNTDTETATGAVEITEAAIGVDDEAADADDDAMLDLIAAEMSAPDVSDAHLEFDDPEMAPEVAHAEPEPIAPVEQIAAAPVPAPTAAPVIESAATAALRVAPVRAEPPPQPEPEPSIGSTLIADGLLRKHAANDPLAALRRLSQAEKIALFS